MYLLFILLKLGGTNIFQFRNTVLPRSGKLQALYCALPNGVAQYQEFGMAVTQLLKVV